MLVGIVSHMVTTHGHNLIKILIQLNEEPLDRIRMALSRQIIG